MKSSESFSKYRQRNVLMVLFLLVIIMLLMVLKARGQSISTQSQYARSFYLDAGIGLGGSGTAYQIEMGIQCSEKGMLLLGVDLVSGGSVAPFAVKANSVDAGSPYVAYGRIKKTRNNIFIGSVGLASTEITKYGNVSPGYVFIFQSYESTQSTVLSLHLQGQVMFTGSFAGLSLTGFTNINGSYSYGGLTVGLALGKVNFLKK